MATKLIELNGLNKTYRTGKLKTTVLHDVNLTIEQGDFFLIMGPSGAGKSTLINILGLLDNEYSGTYLLSGKSYKNVNEQTLSMTRRENVGFIFQNFKLIDNLNVRNNILLPSLYNKHIDKTKITSILENLGLENKEKNYPTELSGGQKQRVAIARSLLSNPKILIADEPTGALDSKNSSEVMSIFQKLNTAGKTIILVTHDEHLKTFCNRGIKIIDGRVHQFI